MRQDHADPIAVVGIGYRAPGLGRKGLWEYLAEARCAWSEVPSDRFDGDSYYHADSDKPGCYASRGGHFLPDDIYAFDPAFFNIRAQEAKCMDPQHRLLLECAFEAAEQAGIRLSDLAGSKTGVFSANEKSEYCYQTVEDLPITSKYTGMAIPACMFANRISYFFDLTGPSVCIDTACASSASAIHIACQSIRAGECSSAFVGGASLIINASCWTIFDTMGALSAEGKCLSYDPRGSGFGRAEGAGCLLIKRLSDAIRDGDPIQAVIRNTAISHGGRTNGITLPSRPAQEALLRLVHEQIDLDPTDTPVVEGHGTGTKVGDPIEANAIVTVLGNKHAPTYLGSVKSNFGHTESTSGVLAVIKAILMLKHDRILPNASTTTGALNPKIESPELLKLVREVTPWPSGRSKRIVVSNFGLGGSNAAVLLESAASFIESPFTSPESPQRQLYVFSARSDISLKRYLNSVVDYLSNSSQRVWTPEDLAWTLGQRRTHHSHRLTAQGQTLEELRDNLVSKLETGRIVKAKLDSTLLFVFTGQGAQYARMGLGLEQYPIYAATISKADTFLKTLGCSWSLVDELKRPVDTSRVDEPEVSQPACTAIQIAVLELLQSWGVLPSIVTGHSSGEIAAAYAAGYVSFEAALAVAFYRGQAALTVVHDKSKHGAMLALGTSEEQAHDLIDEVDSGYATVAAVNSPSSVTVSGDHDTIDQIESIAKSREIFARRLKVSVAYHSRHMASVGHSYQESIERFCETEVDHDRKAIFVSSVTGHAEDRGAVDASYWVSNLLGQVRFSQAVKTTFELGDNEAAPSVMIEIGPHAALKGPLKQILDSLPGQRQERAQYVPSLVRGEPADRSLLELAGNLVSAGFPLDLAALHAPTHGHRQVVDDLPPYEWDHSVSYHNQSRFAKAKAFPASPYHPFLGWKSPYCEGNEHSFRQVLTLDEMPWLREHNVAGDVIFPMTGYITLGIAAMETLVGGAVPFIIQLRDFIAKSTLQIAEETQIDITTKLRPAVTGSASVSHSWWTFEVLSWSGEHGWTTHAEGHLELDARLDALESRGIEKAARVLAREQLIPLDHQQEYDTLRALGLNFGPRFANMTAFGRAGSDAFVHEVDLRRHENATVATFEKAFTLAPLLDSFCHAMGGIQGLCGPRVACVAAGLGRFRLLRSERLGDVTKFKIVTHLTAHDDKLGSYTAHVTVFGEVEGSLTPLCELDQLAVRSISAFNDGDSSAQRLPDTFDTELVPYPDLIDGPLLQSQVRLVPTDPDELLQRESLNAAAIYYMSKALDETAADPPPSASHLRKFKAWAQTVVAANTVKPSLQLLQEVSAKIAQGELICAVGERLTPILRGEVEPLEIMMKDNLLHRCYEQDVTTTRANAILANLVRLLSDAKPYMRILEIGGGTASATRPLLEALSQGRQGPVPIEKYTFTDISAGFFEKAREKLARWIDKVEFRKLDIGQDPLGQGLEPEYDLIIASNVLHATPDMERTMGHTRSLLRPGGKLVLLECCAHPALTLGFSLLPGWWMSQDQYRSDQGPMLTENTWDRLLRETGWSGVDVAIPDSPNPSEHLLNIICTTNDTLPESPIEVSRITVAGNFANSKESQHAHDLADELGGRFSCYPVVQQYNDLDTHAGEMAVFIDGPHESVLSKVDARSFDRLQKMLLHTDRLVWVIPEGSRPDAYMAKGLFRTLRLEDPGKLFLLCENVPNNATGTSAIGKLVQQALRHEDRFLAEQEFVWTDDAFYVPRLRCRPEAEEVFAREFGPKRTMQEISSSDHALELTVEVVGSPDSIYFHRTDARAKERLGEEEVIIEVHAAGINSRDLALVLGSMPWQAPGLDGAGIVTTVGAKVTDLQPGDRVFYISNVGGLATHVRIPAVCAYKLSDRLSLVDAASMPFAYATALTCLQDVARLQSKESILIHAASGAVGQAAISLAQHLGADIFVTAGTPEKRQFLQDTFGIPRNRIFSSRDAVFRDRILRETSGKGVDVVLNSLSGELLQRSWDVIADFGRFVEIGKKDLLQNNYLGLRPFDRNVTFSGVNLHQIFAARPHTVERHLSDIISLFERGSIAPIRPVTRVPISDIKTALRKLQGGNDIGKLVVTVDPSDEVLADVPSPLGQPWEKALRRDATYIITGGTGGIGRSLASWMFENGAEHVVLLGRSGSSNPDVAALLERYSGSEKCLRAIACDVGDRSSLTKALSSLQEDEDVPPIRGVVHGALYLRDSVFENATFDDWQKVTAPKNDAAWTLHELLPNLDFFVSLASVTGLIGHAGQSIYSGTTTFLDALTAYRRSLGLPANSISLPVVEDVGYVASRGLNVPLKRSLGVSLTASQIQTVVKAAILNSSALFPSNGAAMSCVRGEDTKLPWDRFNMLAVLSPRSGSSRSRNKADTNAASNQLDGAKDLMSALMSKICAMTMMEPDEVSPTRPLTAYALDSLISVELRSWVKRVTGVNLALTKILAAKNLEELVEKIKEEGSS